MTSIGGRGSSSPRCFAQSQHIHLKEEEQKACGFFLCTQYFRDAAFVAVQSTFHFRETVCVENRNLESGSEGYKLYLYCEIYFVFCEIEMGWACGAYG